MNYGGSNGVYETQMFLIERIVLVNSSRSTTLCCKREFRWTGLTESVSLDLIQIWSSYGCCKREFRWIGFAETVVLEFIQIVDCVNTVEEIHLDNDLRANIKKRRRMMNLYLGSLDRPQLQFRELKLFVYIVGSRNFGSETKDAEWPFKVKLDQGICRRTRHTSSS